MGGEKCMLMMVVVVDKCHVCDILKCTLLCIDGIRSFMSGNGGSDSERKRRRRKKTKEVE